MDERPNKHAVEASDIAQQGGIYHFGAFALNLQISELHTQGERVALTPQSLAVLTHLLKHRERTVSREELLREVWSGVQVNEGSLRQAIFELRQTLHDDADAPAFIMTVRTKGYRFVAEVTHIEPSEATFGSRASTPHAEPQAEMLLTAPAQRTQSTLFGREHELVQLRAAREAARTVSGRALWITGEAGLGKSRLVRELIDQTQSETELLCLEAHADQAGSVPPFWPFTQLLSAYLERVSPALRARCTEQAAAALDALSAHEVVERDMSERALDADVRFSTQQRFLLFDQAARVLVELSRERPALLLLEDLHWADAASLAFLGHLARVLPQSRLLFVATARLPQRRGNKEDRPLLRALEALQRGALNQRIALEPLGTDAIFEMLQANAPGVALELAHQVHTLTRGNPLFSLELARLTRSAGAAEQLLLGERPEVLAVIRARIAALPQPCAEALAAASVIGRHFSVVELSQLLDEDPVQTLTRLDECVRAGVMSARGQAHFALAHPLIERAAYDDIPRAERAELHGRHARVLERSGQVRSLPHLHELSHHTYHAAVSASASSAIAYATECAQRAMEATAFESARLMYERALECCALILDYPPAQRLALELGRAEALRALGSDNAALNALFLELGERAHALAQPQLVARAALGYTGQLPVRFVPTRLAASAEEHEVVLLERALAGLAPEPSTLRVLLLCALGYALGYSRDWRRCQELYDEALRAAELLAKPWLTARVLMLHINVCAAPGLLLQRLQHADRLVALTQQHRLSEVELEARLARMLIRMCLVDAVGAARDAERIAQLGEQLDTDAARARALVPQIWQAFMQGRVDDFASLSNQAAELAGDDLYQRDIWLLRGASVSMLRSTDVTDTLRLYERMHESLPNVAGLRAVLAAACATAGRFEAAMQHFDALARDDFAALPRSINWLTEMSFLADAACHMGDSRRPQLIYDALLPYADEFTFFGGEVCPGMPMAYSLAILATTLGDFGRAQLWLESARATCVALGADMLQQYVILARAHLAFLSTPASAHEAPRAMVRAIVAYCEPRQLHWLRTCALMLEAECIEHKRRALPRASSLRIAGPGARPR